MCQRHRECRPSQTPLLVASDRMHVGTETLSGGGKGESGEQGRVETQLRLWIRATAWETLEEQGR